MTRPPPNSTLFPYTTLFRSLLAQRHAATTQHPHTPLAGGGSELVGQPGLADPRLPADQRHQRPVVGGGARQQVPQPRQLLGAADEPPGRDLVDHDAKYAPPVLSRAGRGSKDPGFVSEDPATAGCRCRPWAAARKVARR